ncbi:hypothetical protein SB48_HM08orf05916 [Heyndrickxia coagulans]|uniref:Uncharacterized protein n=1 Tax=Heyndrickxia coagulans TaxID=1398 RepID=A0AAN0T9Q3_HEYCO|nr:hypothetical protein SB48_HM08orf05916 [Heyndrickxia coagulans]
MGSLFGKEIKISGCSGRPQWFFAWDGTRVYSGHIDKPTPNQKWKRCETFSHWSRMQPSGILSLLARMSASFNKIWKNPVYIFL